MTGVQTCALPILDKIVNAKHLRVGIKVSGTGSVWLRAGSVETGNAATVSYRPSPDTLVKALVVNPISSVPLDPAELKRDLQDYTLVSKYNIPATPGTFAVGGTPGRRAYLRFNIPRAISDCSTVIRATLRLTQRPVKLGSLRDSMVVHAHEDAHRERGRPWRCRGPWQGLPTRRGRRARRPSRT